MKIEIDLQSGLKNEKWDESPGKLVARNIGNDVPDADAGPPHWPQVAPEVTTVTAWWQLSDSLMTAYLITVLHWRRRL